jgi:hypothetical protein
MDEPLKGGGKLQRSVGWHQQSGRAVDDRLGDPTNVVRHHGQAVCRRLQVNQTKALDAAVKMHTRHREDIGAVVDLGKFIVGQVAEEAHHQVRLPRRRRLQGLLVAALALAADDPVLEIGANPRGQQLQGLQRRQLPLAGMQPADGQNHHLCPLAHRPRRNHREIRT